MREALLARILDRDVSLFAADVERHREAIDERLRDARLLVLGAAGSIGSAFVKQVAAPQLGCLHLVDLSENNLVEVIRDLRSSDLRLPPDLQALPLDIGGAEFHAFLEAASGYDYVVNFAALKHVRSEKDPYSLMRMLAVNVVALRELLERLPGLGVRRLFSVSSDKAVRPHNAMGATKSIMEAVLLEHSDRVPVSSARFANVAFSDGSLLYGFERRLAKRQPLSAPRDVRRYFLSHEEAGQLCLLATFVGANREVFVPRLDPASDLHTFSEIALWFLEDRGLTGVTCASEREARERAARLDAGSRAWPCWFFDSDTTGEKEEEEFFADWAEVDWSRFREIGVLRPHRPEIAPRIDELLARLEALRASGRWTKEQLIDAIRVVVPDLQHDETGRNLDQKM